MPRWLRRIVLEAPSVSVAVMLAICGGVFLFRAGRPELFDTMGPLVVVLGVSVSESQFIAFPPQGLSLKWYAQVFGDARYLVSFRQSLVLALIGFLATVALASVRAKVRWKIAAPSAGWRTSASTWPSALRSRPVSGSAGSA